ncbi:MAG: ion transporter [Pseudomonadota bacterium]
MSLTDRQRDRAIEWLRDIFGSDLAKLGLSAIIILSLLPFEFFQNLSMVFFGIFAVEMGLRFAILLHELRSRSLNKVEVVVFGVDFLATLSFLPLETIFGPIRFLRLLRLTRMLLLMSYWGSVVQEIWTIVTKRERLYQLGFVASVVVILTFLATILLFYFQSLGVDFNEDGLLDSKTPSFTTLFWWSFRQLQDPGNLIKNPTSSLAFFCSFFLTMAGIFIIAFLIGIGTSVVEELVTRSRRRRLGIRRHSVIANLGPNSNTLVEELVTYYAKSFRSARIAAMGTEERYDYLYDNHLRKIRYRQGQAISVHDLRRVDADRARRVILLGHPTQYNSDSEVISQILSVREVNPSCWIFAELFGSENAEVARQAGEKNTVPILAQRFVALLLADIVVFPGVEQIYSELLTSRGHEIYSCIYGIGSFVDRSPPSAALLPFGEMLKRCYEAHNVILLGYLLADDGETIGVRHVLNPGVPFSEGGIEYPAIAEVDKLRGFFGVANNFEQMKTLVNSLPDIAAEKSNRVDSNVPAIQLFPATYEIHEILVCGFHKGLVDFCEQLIRFAESLKIYVMVPQREKVEELADMFTRSCKFRAPDRQVSFCDLGNGTIEYSVLQHAHKQGTIQIIVGDSSDEQTFIGQEKFAYNLANIEVVLLAPTVSESDPDALTALALLKLLRLAKNKSGLTNPRLRIVCEVMSTEKAQLFERRFATIDRSSCCPITIVAREGMRHAFLAQSVFVPGIASIYRELLSEQGNEICRLLFCGNYSPDTPLNFGQLLSVLHERDGLILLGVELIDEEGGPHLVVNPSPRSDDFSFRAQDIRSLFAVGDSKVWFKNRGGICG